MFSLKMIFIALSAPAPHANGAGQIIGPTATLIIEIELLCIK
jgi:FKBP-type peptidyl-prolyl cis-trans isomerase